MGKESISGKENSKNVKSFFIDFIETDGGFIFWIILFFALLFATIIVYSVDNSWSVQVLAACLGAIITIIVTRLLLSSQNKIEREREKERRELEDKLRKDFEFYNAKLKVYSESINQLWKTYSDSSKETKNKLQDSIFDKLIFYLSDNLIKQITQIIADYINGYKKKESEKKESEKKEIVEIYADITTLLKQDLDSKGEKPNKNHEEKPNENNKENPILKLRLVVDDLMQTLEREDKNNNKQQIITNPNNKTFSERANQDEIKEEQQEQVTQQVYNINNQAWHFIMWDDYYNMQKLKEGRNELYFVENEEWRTNLLRQIEKDDLIMLYRKGGYGYIGAFRAKGRRIFDIEKGEEEEVYFDKEYRTITGPQYDDDLKMHDIYEVKDDDGLTFISSIIVEPIAFMENGVGNPGGVYRRTICRYDADYAWELMRYFREAKNKEGFGMIDGKKLELADDKLMK